VSDDGDLWAYTGAGLIHIENDSAQQVSRHDDSRAPKAAILADDGGSLWFGGLELSRWAGGETTPAQGDLAGTTIRALFQDIEGTLWVGTDRRGLYQLSDGPLTTYSTTEGIVGRAVLPVTEGPDGAIWVGTRCGGLSRFDGRRFQPVLYDEQTPENCVHSLLTASDGTLWISDSQGLAALRGETLTRYGREQGLPVGSPRALMEDGAGRLWIGTWSGLYRLEGGRFTRFGSADGLADERVLFITEDDAGALWIGSDSGLSRFQNGVFTAYDQASGLPPGAVRAILATGDEVWIGTYGGGLARLEDGVFTRYTTADGLYDEAISSILADGEGHLWLCGNRGLFNVSRIELEAFARGEISRIRSIAFGASDGMKSPECNGGGQPSGWKSSDGRLWFATIHGVSVVNPGEPWSPQIPPTVIGEEIVTGGRRLFPEGGITVGPGRDLEVHYTGISLAAPERVTFRYRLDGFDADWIEVGSRRAAYYTNLPGGRYRFEVEAGFDGHRWGSQPFRVDVHVQPRFFETPLFVGLAVLLVVLTFLAAHRLRIRHLKARDAELSALAARG
jgi:ligand-binding sensor domain-containing protein